MHLLIWIAALVGLVFVMNSKIKLDRAWKEYAAAAVFLVWAVGLLLSFPVIHWEESNDSNCRTEYDRAGPHLVCD